MYFNLMHPVRGATTYASSDESVATVFQSNAPRAGCDVKGQRGIDAINIFQSNAPHAGCDCVPTLWP